MHINRKEGVEKTMRKLRQDGWTKDDDILLAEIVLSHIRNGKTQLDAFKLAGEKLARTPAACGFRWNATIRHQYEDAIYLAKNARKQSNYTEVINNDSELYQQEKSIDSAITLLRGIKKQVNQQGDTIDEKHLLKQLKEENKILHEEIERYREAWKEMGNLWEWIAK